MDNPVHGRHAAIYSQSQAKAVSPSFYYALGVAVALHAGLAYYLIQQNFSHAAIEIQKPDEGPIITIENIPAPKPVADPKPVIRVHDSVATPKPADETLDLIPVKTDTSTLDTATSLTLPTASTDGAASSGTSDSSAGETYAQARWTRFPDGDALASYYPPRAADNEVEGTATVQCTVLDTAGRVACVAVSEKPGGYGFGAATARMVQDKGRVDTTQGNVRVGSVLRQTVAWRLD